MPNATQVVNLSSAESMPWPPHDNGYHVLQAIYKPSAALLYMYYLSLQTHLWGRPIISILQMIKIKPSQERDMWNK